VLYGQCDGDLDCLLTEEFLHERLLSRYALEVVRVADGADVLREAETGKYDLFVLFLNNIIMPKGGHRDLIVGLVRRVKQQCGKPIITLCGLRRDAAFAEEVTAAGADFFFLVPFDAQEWSAAIECCLAGDSRDSAASPAVAGPRRVVRPEPPLALAGPYRKGDRIGHKYVVLGVLGAGGFGVVYLAHTSDTNETCALKTFHERFLADAVGREAFKKEAILWVGLEEHPFILAARWVDEVSGRLFVAMDYVAPDAQGRVTLEDHLADGAPVKAEQALAWAIQFCHGMEHASANGLRCHRDIKPGNVLIASGGMLKITDFGLAAAAEGAWRAGGRGGSLVSASQGRVGLSMVQSEGGGWCGTPGYIAPEVYEGKGADVRSDIYGFGLMLWQMAAGSPAPPFHAAEVQYRGDAEAYAREYQAKVYEKQRTGDVPPLDGLLARVIGRCLAYRPSQRYANFRELREALEPLYHGLTDRLVEVPRIHKTAVFWNNKGTSLNTLGRYDEAIRCLEKALEIDLRDAAAWNNKGISLDSLGRYEEAIRCYEKALEIDPQNGMWDNKGISLDSLGRYEEAIRCYEKALEIDPRDAMSWSNKGISLDRLGRHDEAIRCYEKALEIDPRDAAAWSNKGICLKILGRHEEAIRCFEKALEIDPRDADAWHEKGLSLDSLGRYEEAIRCYEKALEIDPRDADAWNKKGINLDRLGQYDEAIRCYEKALEIDPRDAAAWYNKGLRLNNLGRYDEAIRCCEKALEIDPRDAAAWYNKGGCLGSLGRNDEAIRCYEKALEIDPWYAAAWYNKGSSLASLSRNDEAIRCYEKALEIDPRDATACYNKALAEERLGCREAAVATWRTYLALARDDPSQKNWIPKAEEHLRKLERG
jgi:tetratricopeptide (TPR) repeat protein